jgi:hypothetical protein
VTAINSSNINKTNNHLSSLLNSLNTKRPRHVIFEIQVPSKTSVKGAMILVHGKWDMCYCFNHITDSEQNCVAFLIIVKTMVYVFIRWPFSRKYWRLLVYIRYMFRHYFDLTNYRNCHRFYLRWLTLFHCASFSADLPMFNL